MDNVPKFDKNLTVNKNKENFEIVPSSLKIKGPLSDILVSTQLITLQQPFPSMGGGQNTPTHPKKRCMQKMIEIIQIVFKIFIKCGD